MWAVVGVADVNELHHRADDGAQRQDVDRYCRHVKDEEGQDPTDSKHERQSKKHGDLPCLEHKDELGSDNAQAFGRLRRGGGPGRDQTERITGRLIPGHRLN
jgi:hypothetical protein